MGVPTFYRWLCNRYPCIVRELKDCVDELTCMNDLDLLEPNINGEFDCLYLDMNGIIHPCCNPGTGNKPKNEAEMFTRVCDYIDRLYSMVRPRRLLYLAIDGVAPRAKMNQQRSRRYKTALDIEYNKRAYDIAQEEFKNLGYKCPEYIEKWDSNVITPGTPFMERLTMCLHSYIRHKYENDESWKSITVIFSDSNVPGEGEHKILEFIRSQRTSKDYDQNTKHVLYGADADLIMLGLSTHEVNFYIIREAIRDFKVDSPSNISIVYNKWVEEMKSIGVDVNKYQIGPNLGKKLRLHSWWSDIEIVDLSVLREYLFFDFKEIKESISIIGKHKLIYDFERCLDDFVFLCFFVGNDFLPNLPVFSIFKGTLDQLIGIYIKVIPHIGDYLTFEGNINYSSIVTFFNYLKDLELEIVTQETRFIHNKQNQNSGMNNNVNSSTGGVSNICGRKRQVEKRPTVSIEEYELLVNRNNNEGNAINGDCDMNSKLDLNDNSQGITDLKSPGNSGNEEISNKKRRCPESIDSYFNDHINKLIKYISEVEYINEENVLVNVDELSDVIVNIDDPTSILKYRLNYYNNKFQLNLHLSEDDNSNQERAVHDKLNEFTDNICFNYLRGLSWVLRYYYHGVPSWDWFFPFHYAPYVLDITETISNPNNIMKVKESLLQEFDIGKPFTQFEQLMSVLPPKSGRICLPDEFYKLMIDSNNPINKYYPTKFKQDPNGNKQRWKWVALLPFIDQNILLNTVRPLEEKMNLLSRFRNKLGKDIIYSFKYSPLKELIERLSIGESESFIQMSDMQIFGTINKYRTIENNEIQGNNYVLKPIYESCDSIQDSSEVVKNMLEDNCLQWRGILSSSFNTSIESPMFVVSYFNTKKPDKYIINDGNDKFKDVDSNIFKLYKVGYGSKLLPNAKPCMQAGSLPETELINQERKFKGFKANYTQKVLLKLFSYWDITISSHRKSILRNNRGNAQYSSGHIRHDYDHNQHNQSNRKPFRYNYKNTINDANHHKSGNVNNHRSFSDKRRSHHPENYNTRHYQAIDFSGVFPNGHARVSNIHWNTQFEGGNCTGNNTHLLTAPKHQNGYDSYTRDRQEHHYNHQHNINSGVRIQSHGKTFGSHGVKGYNNSKNRRE
ncbi:Rat1 Kar1 Rat1 like 5 exonuclease [Cryptosporidium bovis]|uniref:Rat1 Kar1 Rat1 like 5 exonuclease n=1 Tax=Cryptosporidium bovis TaxID=310047 RepID=UPI00351A3AFF|nr:Rat1 Kar1 Rat1 like 5 exonuclease [Cryptosporidium bovis]